MSSTSDLMVISPAGWLDVAAVSPIGVARKHWLYQARVSDTVAVRFGGELLCVAALFPEDRSRVELCVRFGPSAKRHMRRLLRLCQLMLRPLADHGVVILARVAPEDRTQARMHLAAGFVPAGEDGKLMVWSA